MALRIAHRGAKGYADENTIDAFQKALELGCDGIELDVRLSADGHPMVIHDETLDRTTDAIGYVRHKTLSDFQKIRVGMSKQKVPTLRETLDYINGSCLLNIEIKSADATEAVAREISAAVSRGWKINQIIVSSFDWTALQIMKNLNKEVLLGVLTDQDPLPAVDFGNMVGAFSIHPHHHSLNPKNADLIHYSGLRIFAWTANEPSDIQRLKSFGVDAIISDFPDRI